jgi:hypothetical protein
MAVRFRYFVYGWMVTLLEHLCIVRKTKKRSGKVIHVDESVQCLPA